MAPLGTGRDFPRTSGETRKQKKDVSFLLVTRSPRDNLRTRWQMRGAVEPRDRKTSERDFRVNIGRGLLHSLTEKFPYLQGGTDTVGRATGSTGASWTERKDMSLATCVGQQLRTSGHPSRHLCEDSQTRCPTPAIHWYSVHPQNPQSIL